MYGPEILDLFDLLGPFSLGPLQRIMGTRWYVTPEAAITIFELLMMGGVARNMLSN